jgi:hypothetical protein
MNKQNSSSDEEFHVPDGLLDATQFARVGKEICQLLMDQYENGSPHDDKLIKPIFELCKNYHGDYEVEHIENVIINLLSFVCIFMFASEADHVESCINVIKEITDPSSQEIMLIPYFESDKDSESSEEAPDHSQLRVPRRISLSMCFDDFTENEAMAVFFHSIVNALQPDNRDLIAKLEVFEKPLDGPYAAGLVTAREFIDVNSSRKLISKLVKKVNEARRAA